ncbi:MAG TPA: hypothetical protein VFZ58_00370 [Candidatus Saccharimonadales bacterium]
MPGMLQKALNLFTGGVVSSKQRPLKRYSERDLLRMESAIGRQLFGPIPVGHQREFFCLDARTWIWYESWYNPETKKRHEHTTRYEVHSNGIIKIQEGQPYIVLEGQELKNLEMAVQIYHERVMRDVYNRNHFTGEVFPTTT